MRWDDVQIFLEVARQGTLSGAARQLGLDHSTVYRRVRALEEDLRVRLFEREGGRYTLTDAARAALPAAEDAAAAMLAFRTGVEGHDASLTGVVRLTAPESLLPLLTPHLGPFREAYPGIQLQVTFSERFLDLGRREADVALRPIPRPDPGVAGRRIGAIAWCVYAPTDVGEGDVHGLPWAAYSSELARLGAVAWWEANHRDEPVQMTVNSVTAMESVLCGARCRGMLPCFVGDPDPRLRRVRPPVDEAASALWLLVHEDLRHTARIRALVDYLWTALREEVPLLEGDRA
ncbi:MAG: LysR family transcriptional regulator [Alphaproteobacteria bacterium]|nr:LysR family transcriptional regulator [Alphaproteobacteria bacterium]